MLRLATWRRWLTILLVALLALVAGGIPQGALAAPTEPNYPIDDLGKGDPLYIADMMYRVRHTVMTENEKNEKPDEYVGYGRNVAVARWVTQVNGEDVEWYVAADNVSWLPTMTDMSLIDIFQRNPITGQWKLVDVNGNEMGPWDKSSQPTMAWDLGKVPELADALKQGKLDSERVLKEFMVRQLKKTLDIQADEKVDQVGSEKMFCSGPARCLANLKDEWFNNLERAKVATDKFSKGKLKGLAYDKKRKVTDEQRQDARQRLKANDTSDQAVADLVEEFVKKGKPTGLDASVVLGDGGFGSAVGNSGSKGPAASALSGTDPGGIDFSTLELRYLSEGSDGQLRYAYSAAPATGSDSKVTEGKVAATEMSDAFYVWLSLPSSTFWVNLNPNEPDRIADPKLATTDVGRILLEADLRMKKLAAQLTNPNTDTGKQFWGDPSASSLDECTITRQWIVPKPASVYEKDGGLYIVDAPLEVKAEAEEHKGTMGDASCPVPSQRMESVFEQAILPKVEDAVNHSPDFADLRRVYLARVAAEWYRDRHIGALADMIDKGDVSRWPALQQWSSKDVFNAYVKSYKEHEYTVKKEFDSGGSRYSMTYTDGGVDFGSVPFDQVPEATFQQQHPDLANTVQQSLQQAAPDKQGKVWLGAINDAKPRAMDLTAGDDPEDQAWENQDPPPDAPSASSTPWVLIIGGVVVGLVAVAILVLVVKARKRRRTQAFAMR